MQTPTAQELADQNLARLESALGQTAPINRLAFLRVLAAMEALTGTALFKFGIDRARQNLALTAGVDGLTDLGGETNTPRKVAVATVLTATLPALTDTLIPATTSFIGVANGVRYYLDSSAIAVDGVAELSMTAEEVGAAGNLAPGDTLTIVSAVAGASAVATVVTLTTTGADEENIEVWRQRILFAMRATTGGGNPTDHRSWAEAVPGVKAAFPYAGKPSGISYPGDRTIYIEADTTVDPDGIAPVGLLSDVRDAINIDPETSLARPTLGLTDSTLYIESIVRTEIDVIISNLVTPIGQAAAVQTAINTALDVYFGALVPYVGGVDLPQDRNDQLTALTLGKAVQEVLDATGSSAEGVSFEVAAAPYDLYILAPGERTKTGTVTYVVV